MFGLLLDRGLDIDKADLKGTEIKGYDHELRSHIDVALEVLSYRADIALTIKPVAGLLGLDFIPIRWERYDLLILKSTSLNKGFSFF